jgi:5,5'-dehydrodivanillate O-demethylase oxygenase subunit
MLSAEENLRLTRTSRGTEMGELLRRYWHPFAAAAEFDEEPIKTVRLLGEDLVCYRDRAGRYGLLERHCPHRRADLAYGFVEERGIRCSYHGWAFDEAGRCTAQPFEDVVNPSTRFRDAIRTTAYPVEERAGMLFAYLGPEPVPCCPTWEPFTWENGFRQIVLADVACNWLQCTENNIDPVHFEWLHGNWSARLRGSDESGPTHLKIGVDEWEFGFRYKRILETTDEEHDNWRSGRLAILPNLFVPNQFEYRTPVDDDHTLSIVLTYDRVPLDCQPYVQERVPYWHAQLTDPVTGRWVTSHVINQDVVAWAGQGVLADRSKEHLGRSDIGVVKLRQQLLADLEAVGRGEDPKGVIRDPQLAACVPWPFGKGAEGQREITRSALSRQIAQRTVDGEVDYYPFFAGQPDHVRREYEKAMGL